MINIIIAFVLGIVLGGLAAFVYLSVMGKMK